MASFLKIKNTHVNQQLGVLNWRVGDMKTWFNISILRIKNNI